MTPALHSHSISDDAYTSLPHDLTPTSSYPPFSTSLHHGDTINDHNASAFGGSSPSEHHALPLQHTPLEHNSLHLDPNLSPEESRQFPSSSENTAHHDFGDAPTPSSNPKNSNATTHNAPPIMPNAAPSDHFDMLPPPPSTHPTWNSLHAFAQSHASTHGYALSINTTAKNRSRIKLACVCYGAPKNTHKLTPETRVRKNRVSYKTGCKMWVEGKKMDDGSWVLRVGEGMHNHKGRPSEGWAVQRKRTWGVQGGRVGVGGVTAMEELEQASSFVQDDGAQPVERNRKTSLSLESGGFVWKIVEQEMLRKGVAGQGRDRGVGRTVKILEDKLPGIHIFKRDVYNIRAQIRRARKAAGQRLGEGLTDSDMDDDADEDRQSNQDRSRHQHQSRSRNDRDGPTYAQIDPSLIVQCNSALENMDMPTQDTASEVELLRAEVAQLRQELRQAHAQRTKEVEEKNRENRDLRVQLAVALCNEDGVSS